MRRIVCGLALAAVALFAPATASAARPFAGLQPGGLPDLNEQVTVNIVYLGFGPGQVDGSAVSEILPATYDPVAVQPAALYGIDSRIGLHYTYDYRQVTPDAAYQDAFFAALGGMAQAAPLTEFQTAYNDQNGNVLDVTDNSTIDAPSVERWLAENPPAGVDPTRNTLVFVNWYGRPDFRFHVYTKTGEADPDTGYDFGVNRESRKLVAWGGTANDDEETGRGAGQPQARLWFFDVSAGPESWGGSWNVDDADLDGDAAPDYRIPPAWEYVDGGHRAPSELSADLGRVARYVGIDLLFTSSPIYPPYLTPTRLPRSINLDVNTYEAIPELDASASLIKDDLLLQEESELVHDVPLTIDKQDVPFTEKAQECYTSAILDFLLEPTASCYPERGFPPAADLFLHAAMHVDEALDGGGDYEAVSFNYAVPDELPSAFLGIADDNWFDGTQSFVFSTVSPAIIESGYGLTTTLIHEYGHHFGMSHPHDGWDSEEGAYFDPTGPRYFAWLGDESNTIMSYIDLNWDFSQFDRDNYDRHHAAGYVLNANAIAGAIVERIGPSGARKLLAFADLACAAVGDRLQAHRYPATLAAAQECYRLTRRAARHVGVPVNASREGWTIHAPPPAVPAAAKAAVDAPSFGAVDADPRLLAKRQAR